MSKKHYTKISPPDLQYAFVGEYIVNNRLSRIHKVVIDNQVHYFTTDKDEVVFFIQASGDRQHDRHRKSIGKQYYMSLNPMVDRFDLLPDSTGYTAKSLLTAMNIEIVVIYTNEHILEPDLTAARRFLSTLSGSLEIGFIHKAEWQARQFATYSGTNQLMLLKPVILCLTIGDFCVSSIELEPEDDATYIEIRSTTDVRHRRRHYNTMLRAVAIMVTPLIWPNAMHIMAYATNPISVHTLVTKFDAHAGDATVDNYETIPIAIPLSSETLARAKAIYSQYKI